MENGGDEVTGSFVSTNNRDNVNRELFPYFKIFPYLLILVYFCGKERCSLHTLEKYRNALHSSSVDCDEADNSYGLLKSNFYEPASSVGVALEFSLSQLQTCFLQLDSKDL
jgi:hypothetical protein